MSNQQPTADAANPSLATAPSYQAQARGGDDAYASYYAGMDKSMQQKVALTTAFFPPSGTLVDMGCGSGSGSFDLASLFDGLQVIGVDIAPPAVAHAQAHYVRRNLRYQQGDIADPLFPPGSLDGILNSSVWHHLTSFNDFSLREVERALMHQAAALRQGGVLIVRDFVVPSYPDQVWLDLPSHDGDAEGPIASLSTAALFPRFCAQFRSSANPDTPLPFAELPSPKPGWQRFLVSGRGAAEFLLHKDYRSDWDAECREEYLFYRQADFESSFRRHDLRIVLSVELHNPWIIENRLRGRCAIFDPRGLPLPLPPTNYLIVGEKVAPRHGVRLRVRTEPLVSPQFLTMHTLRHQKTGQIFQLAERPNPVLDVIPWFRAAGRVLVLAKHGFPRPLATTLLDSPSLDGAQVAGYLTETLTAQVPRSDDEATQPDIAQLLSDRASVPRQAIKSVSRALRYYTSPGGLSERVTSWLCELSLSHDGLSQLPDEVPNYTPFTTAGRVQPFVASQLLRAAQVGGLQDARLELNLYHLLWTLGESLGPWIGVELSLQAQQPTDFVPQSATQVLTLPDVAVFEPMAQPDARPGFLALHTAHVEEQDRSDEIAQKTTLELCAPRAYSLSTVSLVPVIQLGNDILVGVERRELPAVQLQTNGLRSGLITCPAWRLPKTITTRSDAEAEVSRNLLGHFGVRALRVLPLGGKYYPSIGATPEVVYPMLAEVDAASLTSSALAFVRLSQLLSERDRIEDAHLLIALCRLAHALGVSPA
jgi:SAM-dependent methyltransferase